MLLIPAIDLRAGQCVRLREGDFATQISYSIEPNALLRRYQGLGVPWVHVVDLDGAKEGLRLNAAVVARLAQEQGVRLQVGGGVREASTIEALLSVGVDRVVVGSAAVLEPLEVARWIGAFGAERICLAFDVRIGPGDEPQVHTHGWMRNSMISLWTALAAYPTGLLRHVLCTDIARDGTMRGPNLALYRSAIERYPRVGWQASGGIRNAADLADLERAGVTAAVSGKAVLEERVSLKELRKFLRDASSPVSTSAPARS